MTESRNEPKSNVEWRHWGEHDPLYGVMSVLGKSRTNKSPWTEDDFYASATSEFAVNFRNWERYGVVRDAVVEIGCGAGRMTRCLQTVFDAVEACDVSEGMLELVKKNCDSLKVRTHQTSGREIPLPDCSVTAAYSTIVFQHFDSPEVGYGYFEEIFRSMKPGGTFMINLPWHQYPNAPIQLPYRLANSVARGYETVVNAFKRALLRMGPTVTRTRIGNRLSELMAATSYDFQATIRRLEAIGFIDIEVAVYYVPIEGRHHPFFFGRKP